MPMDTASEPSNASLSVRDAAAFFAPKEPEQQQTEAQATEPAEVETPQENPEAIQAEADPDTEADATAEPEKVTIEVDGKTVELSKAELADAYKNGLRQADYTRKTMEAAEQRKTADAETTKARQEREQYGRSLTQNHQLLSALINEQQQTIDWVKLANEDPGEYVKQEALLKRRQAALADTERQGRELAALNEAEFENHVKSHIEREHQALLDKLPEWKDAGKAMAEKKLIAEELLSRGFDHRMIFGEQKPDGSLNPKAPGLTDSRVLLMARDAMLYRQMMSKAQAAAKKVSNLPQKMEKPGGGETNPTDGRTVAMKRLSQSGSVRDAAAVFALLK